jgi:hypothetical protein
VPDLNLTLDQLTVALGIVAAVALICLLWLLVLASKVRRLRRRGARRSGGDVGASAEGWDKRLDSLNRLIDDVVADQQIARSERGLALQRFHLVRYDAFEDMGGQMSFSAALLDEHGDGLVVTSINGRTETRTYAKPIKNQASQHNLSEEERQAIAGAMANADRGGGRPSISTSR